MSGEELLRAPRRAWTAGTSTCPRGWRPTTSATWPRSWRGPRCTLPCTACGQSSSSRSPWVRRLHRPGTQARIGLGARRRVSRRGGEHWALDLRPTRSRCLALRLCRSVLTLACCAALRARPPSIRGVLAERSQCDPAPTAKTNTAQGARRRLRRCRPCSDPSRRGARRRGGPGEPGRGAGL